MALDDVVASELQASCNAIGAWSNGRYVKSDECLGALIDILKLLLSDTDEFSVRMYILSSHVIQQDLIPIMESFPSDGDIDAMRLAIRLVANLTMRSALAQTKDNDEESAVPPWVIGKIDYYLCGVKQAFASANLFQTLADRCRSIVSKTLMSRTDEDTFELSRIMMMVTNVLSIGSIVDADSESIRVHDGVLTAIQSTDFEAIILFMAKSKTAVEVIAAAKLVWLMVKYQLPTDLANIDEALSKSERKQHEIDDLSKNLESVLKSDSFSARKMKDFAKRRFSKYSGTFVVKDCGALGGRDVIVYHRVSGLNDIKRSDAHISRKFRVPKNKAELKVDALPERNVIVSDMNVRACLKDTCKQFLASSFNHAISRYKSAFGQHLLKPSDEPYLFNLISFFLEFVTQTSSLNRNVITSIGDAIDLDNFRFAQINLQRYYDLYVANKANGAVSCQRMHAVVNCFKNMLITITKMLECGSDDEVRAAGKTIACNVMYVQEYREAFLMLLKNFDSNKMSTAMLRDTVEAVHYLIKMAELAQKSGLQMFVQNKSARRRARRKRQQIITSAIDGDLWCRLEKDLLELINENKELDPENPFDAAADIDGQAICTLKRIKIHLDYENPSRALSLFRVARKVWPEDERFHVNLEDDPKDEIRVLRYIFDTYTAPRPPIEDQDSFSEDNESDEEPVFDVSTSETHFDLSNFIHRFANTKILKLYISLVGSFKQNPARINNCVFKFLDRLAFGCGQPAYLYQLSLFKHLNDLLNDECLAQSPEFRAYKSVIRKIVGLFINTCRRDPRVFLETLFSKTDRIAYEINKGYGSVMDTKSPQGWTTEQDARLSAIYSEAVELRNNGEFGNTVDIATYIMDKLEDSTKTKRQIVGRLVSMGLITNAKDLKAQSTNKRRWTANQVAELKRIIDPMELGKLTSPSELADLISRIRLCLNENSELVQKTDEQFGNQIKKLGLYKSKKPTRKSSSSSEESVVIGPGVKEPAESVLFSNHSDSSIDETKKRRVFVESDESDEIDEEIGTADLAEITKSLSESGTITRDQISWLLESLADLHDMKKREFSAEALALVPLLSSQFELCRSRTLRPLLIRCGLREPNGKQETFWRLKEDIDPEWLKLNVLDKLSQFLN